MHRCLFICGQAMSDWLTDHWPYSMLGRKPWTGLARSAVHSSESTKGCVVSYLQKQSDYRKTSQELRKAALRVVGCQGVKVFLLKDVIITTSVTTVIFITITIWVFELSQFNFFSFAQFEFLSLVTIWSFKFCHNLFFWVLSQFEFLSFATI